MRCRRVNWLLLGLVLAFSSHARADKPRAITFPSEDGLEITADLYMAHTDKKTPFIVLFHQAGWSRGEYQEIAPILNDLGYNCMAVDLRSGGEVNKVSNKTHERARAAGKRTTHVDALADLRAALAHARKSYASGKLIAWGSSYSAALVLRLAGEQPELVDVALAFAPGEYFGKRGKSGTWIREAAKKIEQPVFITSAKDEKEGWAEIFAAMPSKHKVSYLPTTQGNHGSRALWKKFSDSEGYWKAVKAFLKEHASP